jgi:hypothetical protein
MTPSAITALACALTLAACERPAPAPVPTPPVPTPAPTPSPSPSPIPAGDDCAPGKGCRPYPGLVMPVCDQAKDACCVPSDAQCIARLPKP